MQYSYTIWYDTHNDLALCSE